MSIVVERRRNARHRMQVSIGKGAVIVPLINVAAFNVAMVIPGLVFGLSQFQ